MDRVARMSPAIRIDPKPAASCSPRAPPRRPTRSRARATPSSRTRRSRRCRRRRRAPSSMPRSRRSTGSSRKPAPAPLDYIRMEGEFARYLEDVYSEAPIPRDALDDECEVLVIGAGFGALLLWYRLMKAGFTDVRFCEKGGDVGGTWYWNRYPGIACDVESYSYLPLLEEMGHIPVDEVRLGLRDPGILPVDGRAVRLLRPLLVPHHGRGDSVGRRAPGAGSSGPTGAMPCAPASSCWRMAS